VADEGEPGFGFVDAAGDGLTVAVYLVGVARRGKVVGDLDAARFRAFGLVHG
jgi:hypothetical protein